MVVQILDSLNSALSVSGNCGSQIGATFHVPNLYTMHCRSTSLKLKFRPINSVLYSISAESFDVHSSSQYRKLECVKTCREGADMLVSCEREDYSLMLGMPGTVQDHYYSVPGASVGWSWQ